MTTKSNKGKLSNGVAPIDAMQALGETYGASNKAQFESCKLFGEVVNTGGIDDTTEDGIKAASALFAGYFAAGMTKKTGEAVTEGSLKTYAAQMKLFADKRVYARIAEIEKQALAFVTTTPAKERGNKKFFALAKAAASRVRKAKPEAIPEINPGLFQLICAAKPVTPETPEDLAKSAREQFRLAAIALQETGLATFADLSAIAETLKVDIAIKPAAPVATPSIDMDEYAQFLKFKAMMAATR